MDNLANRPYWFVGAMYGQSNDQLPRFLKEGIWENGYEDRHLDLVKSMQPGDRIAIKAAHTRKKGLPFDNRGHSVAVMKIKAIGTIAENLGDGNTVKVDWQVLPEPKEWYFYTFQGTIWRVLPGDWRTDALIAFAFENKPQDYDKWRNAPFWRERFGDGAPDSRRFLWTRFYEAMALKLREFRNNRTALVEGIHAISQRVSGLSHLRDKYGNGSEGPLRDICPFTVLGIFNRHITLENRKAIAGELAKLLAVQEPVPQSFEGIPLLNNMRSWFFSYEKNRQAEDIDLLWDVFEAALDFVDVDGAASRPAFLQAFDRACSRPYVGWNLTLALFWIRPWDYVSLDARSKAYITQKLGQPIERNGSKRLCSGKDYLAVRDALAMRFQEPTYPVHSFPELSLSAWLNKDIQVDVSEDDEEEGNRVAEEPIPQLDPMVVAPIVPYSIDDILADGCFLESSELERILASWRGKRNLILQGPPGTGKTWLAKRLAFALMGQKDEGCLRVLQFHPNLSYEDFVRGWRPQGDGRLSLVDGPFAEMIHAAQKYPERTYVMVIEEINRGNPAQIFGEMLTLLEADKRTPTEAMELSYRRYENERIFIPANLHVIGTMNIADRSLALMDLALRRRFAFITLSTQLGAAWRTWVSRTFSIDDAFLRLIESRVTALNNRISSDSALGPQYQIGHSYVTPPKDFPLHDAPAWYRQVVESEIGPLIQEYWFDSADKVQEAKQGLLEGV